MIALFPLGTVLVPGLVLPLHVFEPRYRQLLHDLGEHGDPDDRFFGVVAIRQGSEVGPVTGQALHEVGTTAVLRQVDWHADGRADVVTSGRDRFRLLAAVAGAPYQQAEVEWLPEPVGDGAADLVPRVVAALDRYRRVLGGTGEAPDLPADPQVLSYAVAAAMALDQPDRQSLLECPDAESRLRAELALLRRESALLARLPYLPSFDLPRTADPN